MTYVTGRGVSLLVAFLDPEGGSPMLAFLLIVGLVTFVVFSVVLLQISDRRIHRKQSQTSDGIQKSRNAVYQIRCSRCGEKIIPLTECFRCRS